MESIRVSRQGWPFDGSVVGGWVVPDGKLLDFWRITAVHARYVAPAVLRPWTDGWGVEQHAVVRLELRAYHVDLEGRRTLPGMVGALLYEVPPVRWLMLREGDGEALERWERYRRHENDEGPHSGGPTGGADYGR